MLDIPSRAPDHHHSHPKEKRPHKHKSTDALFMRKGGAEQMPHEAAQVSSILLVRSGVNVAQSDLVLLFSNNRTVNGRSTTNLRHLRPDAFLDTIHLDLICS